MSPSKLYFIMLYTLQWQGTHNRVRLQLKCALESWNLEMLVFGEREKPECTGRKTSRSKDENQQQTQPTYDAKTGNQTWATLVGGLHGRQMHNHCAIPQLRKFIYWLLLEELITI